MLPKFLAPYKAYLVVAILLLFVAGGVFLYFQAKHRYEMAIEAAAEAGRQEVLIEQERIVNREVSKALEKNDEEVRVLREEIRSKNSEVNALRRKLQVDHELDALLQAKPGLVLKAVQNGTNQVLEDFEEITK